MVPEFINSEVKGLNSNYRKSGSSFRVNTRWNAKKSEVTIELMDGKETVYVQNKKYDGLTDDQAQQIMSEFITGATMAVAKRQVELPKRKA